MLIKGCKNVAIFLRTINRLIPRKCKIFKMKASIAMATYNGQKYVKEQLDSFTNQTRQPDELIICDDASTDNTVKICKEFAKNANFDVTIIENETNLGLAQNFGKAMSICTGDIVFLSDQDDVWFQDKIEVMIEALDHNDYQLILHDLEYCNNKLELIGETTIERLNKYMNLQSAYGVGMAMVIRRELLDISLPIPKNKFISHDSWLAICASLIDSKYILEKPLAYYRRHEANVTKDMSVNTPKKTTRLFFIKERVLNYLKPVDIDDLKNTIILFKLKIDWIEKYKDRILDLNLLTIEKISNNILILNNSYNLRIERLNFLIVNKALKFISAIGFLFQGKYKEFNGVKSFLKDILYKKRN